MNKLDFLNRYKKEYSYIGRASELHDLLEKEKNNGWKCIELIGTTKQSFFYLIYERVS